MAPTGWGNHERRGGVTDAAASGRRVLVRSAGGAVLLAGIFAIGLNLRGFVAGLPPLFHEFHYVLGLSAIDLAIVGAIPVFCFAVFSLPAAALSRRFGEERVLGAALLALIAGLLLRGIAPSQMLFPGTIAAGAAMALGNVLLPSLVKRRQPERAGALTGLYLAGLSLGGIVAPLIAVPAFTAAGGGPAAAKLALGLWAIPGVAAFAIWVPQLRRRPGPGPAGARQREDALAAAPLRRPARAGLLRYRLAWQIAVFFGLQSMCYYAVLSWLPTLLRERGLAAATAGTVVAVMNFGGTFTSMLVPALAQRRTDQRVLIAGAVAACVTGLAGAVFGPLSAAAAFAFLLGFGQGAGLGIGIYLTMGKSADASTAASLSAFVQGIGYLIASTGPILIGLLRTATGGWSIPVLVIIALMVAQIAAGWFAGRPGELIQGAARLSTSQ